MTSILPDGGSPLLDRTRLLRGAADGRLSATELKVLEAHLARSPEDVAVIAFERRMRSELCRVFSSEPAPSELEERLLSMARGAPRRRRVLHLLVAAAALAAAVLGGRWSVRDADEFGFEGRGALVHFLAAHPHECPITRSSTLSEFDVRDLRGGVVQVASLLGRVPHLVGLEQGSLEFQGMGRCGVPGNSASLHLYFSGAVGSALEGARLDVYVQPEDGRLPISEGPTYRLAPKSRELAHLHMFVWERDGLSYLMTTSHPSAGGAALASAGVSPVSALL